MKILWQSKTAVVAEAFSKGPDGVAMNGGNAYDVQAALALKRHFDVAVDPVAIRKREHVLRYWWRMSRYRAEADLLIMEPFPIVYGRRSPRQRSIAMIHHIDPVIRSSSRYHRWYFDRLIRRTCACDLVVTVSGYWRDYFLAQGCKRVEVIYNAFDPALYRDPEFDALAFRNRFSIPEDRPLVYIGNAIREKGVYEVYDALKDQPYHLVMTGAVNRAPDLPVQYLKLDRADYRGLLRSSDVVIAYSRMIEGWNRIAHEALLSGTPVVGSGTGGMHELLTGAGQPEVSDAAGIRQAVERVLADRAEFAANGWEYVRRFDPDYFDRRWKEVVEQVTGAERNP
jgi:glycosyltransferase involved in cell wall biosynthesis